MSIHNLRRRGYIPCLNFDFSHVILPRYHVAQIIPAGHFKHPIRPIKNQYSDIYINIFVPFAYNWIGNHLQVPNRYVTMFISI